MIRFVRSLKIEIIFIIIINFTLVNLKAQNNDSIKIVSLFTQADQYYQQKNYKMTREYALKVLEINPNSGQAYILIGIAYVSSADICSDNSFSKGMIYCIAADMFEKAREIDKSVSGKALKLINIYSKYFPSREECVFAFQPREGGKYKIGCWINSETTIRFSD